MTPYSVCGWPKHSLPTLPIKDNPTMTLATCATLPDPSVCSDPAVYSPPGGSPRHGPHMHIRPGPHPRQYAQLGLHFRQPPRLLRFHLLFRFRCIVYYCPLLSASPSARACRLPSSSGAVRPPWSEARHPETVVAPLGLLPDFLPQHLLLLSP